MEKVARKNDKIPLAAEKSAASGILKRVQNLYRVLSFYIEFLSETQGRKARAFFE